MRVPLIVASFLILASAYPSRAQVPPLCGYCSNFYSDTAQAPYAHTFATTTPFNPPPGYVYTGETTLRSIEAQGEQPWGEPHESYWVGKCEDVHGACGPELDIVALRRGDVDGLVTALESHTGPAGLLSDRPLAIFACADAVTVVELQPSMWIALLGQGYGIEQDVNAILVERGLRARDLPGAL